MAEQLVGGSFLSAFLQVLFDRMARREVVNLFKGQRLNDGLLKKLTATMISVNGVLDDAEEKQNTKPAVKKWLDELKDAVYEADDLLDEIAYEGLRSQVETGNQVSNLLSYLNPFAKRMERAKLEDVLERLEFLVKQKDTLSLKVDIGEKQVLQKMPTTSLVEESGSLYGREGDKEAIVNMLLSDDGNGNDLGVIPIVGMGGIGKTTLAQLVYNDSRVQIWFDVKAWVCVSEEFDILKITKDILKEVTSVTSDSLTANQLQLELKEKLKGRKLLLVLDDVWNDNYDDWQILQRPLKSLARGSKIIVTTRNESVAAIMHSVSTHYLNGLTDDDCWVLFARNAFNDENCTAYPDLEVIGREIARKCKGLPLAAKILGGLLSSRRDAEEWDKILTSNMWDLSNGNILPALRLSYHYLPSYLKQCFAYCALFPKGYEFQKEELVLLWMAEGFLVQTSKQMEEVGEEYFHDLVSRSLFQPSSEDQQYFIMHDLINDLAKFVSGEFCFRLEDDHDIYKITGKTRHLSYVRTKYDSHNKFEAIHGAKLLRTLLPVGLPSGVIDNEVIYNLLPALEHLRVLSLSQYDDIVELPDSIGNLKHLRYLDLSRTSMEKLPDFVSNLYHLEILILRGCHDLTILPETIGNLKQLRYLNLHGASIERLPESVVSLYNLQKLILRRCEDLVELPSCMFMLVNLCYLDIRGTKLEAMPAEMGKLSKLQELSDFFVAKSRGSSIKELGNLQRLRGELCIWGMQNVVHARDALEANLKVKKQLKKMKLRWGGDTENSGYERLVLEHLQPHVNLESLSIVGYGSTRFPDWLGESSFSNMLSLKLSKCPYCLCLPPLGQLASLKHLSIEACDGVMVVGAEFYGNCLNPFRSLEVLKFERMLQWHTWAPYVNEDKGEAFPFLRELYLRECPNLSKALPDHLPSLITLVVEGCQKLVPSLPKAPKVHGMKLADTSRDIQLKKLHSGLCHLTVDRLQSLDFLLEGMEQMDGFYASLEEIQVSNGCSLKCFPLELFPKLKALRLSKCPILEFLSAAEETTREFTSLNSLVIKKCPKLVCFPKGGLHAPNLIRLQLQGCPKLKSLPECMHLLLHSLVHLKIDKCPELNSFPEGGLPSKLESLEIRSCEKLVAGWMHWNLQMLPSLSCFIIDMHRCVQCFPEETMLPSSLTSLTISNLQNLKFLDYRGIQHLISLKELTIAHCHKLKALPEEGLPSSLFSLSICNCPLLEQRCQRDKGEEWPKIAHIPHIEINVPNVS